MEVARDADVVMEMVDQEQRDRLAPLRFVRPLHPDVDVSVEAGSREGFPEFLECRRSPFKLGVGGTNLTVVGSMAQTRRSGATLWTTLARTVVARPQ